MKKLKLFCLALVMIAFVTMFSGCSSDAGYIDGTYEGSYETAMQTVEVSVAIEDGQISQVNVTNEDEMEGPGLDAVAAIPDMIVEAQSTDVDVVSGATVTSNGIIEAAAAALELATE